MTRLICAAALLTVAVVASCPSTTQASAPEVPAEMVRTLQDRIDLWARRDTHHGVSASVVLADGAQWAGTAGESAPGVPLDAGDLIQIASITKTMTAAVILQLVDEGVLRLEDTVSRWLAPIANVNGAITLRQLLNHTSGVANYTGAGLALGQAIADDPSHVFTPHELLRFAGAASFAPGASTQYTNAAFLLLGMVAEQATGRAITELYRQRLFGPLGLDAILMPGLEEPTRPVAVAYPSGSAINPMDHLSLLSIGHSAFGLLSNASTVARWGHALISGSVISERSQQEMRTMVAAAGNIQGETGSGLGIRGYEYLDRKQFGHSGGATFGSSLLLFDPQPGVTVAVVMNQGAGADHFSLAPVFRGAPRVGQVSVDSY